MEPPAAQPPRANATGPAKGKAMIPAPEASKAPPPAKVMAWVAV
ncbi:MAG: hypothetical protein AAB091_00050 [Elusimicrobiota bacterium]